MLATKDEAALMFAKFVELAEGDSYLVYRAFTELNDPTEEKIKDFILNKGLVSDQQAA